MLSSTLPAEIIFVSKPPSIEVIQKNRKKTLSLESMKRLQKKINKEKLWVIKAQVLYKKITSNIAYNDKSRK